MYLIYLSELNKCQIFVKVSIATFHGTHQKGDLWYMRTDGHDEAKRRVLQLNESAQNTGSPLH